MHPTIRTALLPLLLLGACDRPDSDASSDSAAIDSFRLEADSIALDMARIIAATSNRAGTLATASDTAQWTARLQGEHVSVIEERVRMVDGTTAVRGYFFGTTGALEQVSEQRRVAGAVSRVVQTQLAFSDSGATATRTINGDSTSVPQADIDVLRRRAALLLQAVRAAPPREFAPPDSAAR